MRLIPCMVLAGCFLNGITFGSHDDAADTGFADTGDTFTVIVDGGEDSRYCEDLDGDGYGNGDECVIRTEPPEHYVLAEYGEDCDDRNAMAYPGGDEVDEDVDENCDGFADEGEGDDPLLWCADEDGDGYGAGECLAEYAGFPSYVTNDDDCDDMNEDVNAEADEWPHDLIDNDCDGYTDEDYHYAVVCITTADTELYEVFVAGSSFDDFTYAPDEAWEPGEAWLGLSTETTGADAGDDEAPELVLDRSPVCALYRVDWSEEFVVNGLAQMSDDSLRLLVDASLERHRVIAVTVDGQGDACLLENMQFRCVRP